VPTVFAFRVEADPGSSNDTFAVDFPCGLPPLGTVCPFGQVDKQVFSPSCHVLALFYVLVYLASVVITATSFLVVNFFILLN
jgi:hypothetical protein